jgi:molecular chaperone GrpE
VSPKSDDPRGEEGWEGFAEEASEGNLGPSPELEEAMREAAEAVEARQAESRTAQAGPGAGSAEVEALRRELEETRDKYLRLAADFENFRRRSLKDKEEAHNFGHQILVKDLLPTVDNLERAIDHARKGEGDGTGLLEGMELVLRQLHAVLAKHGVTAIEVDSQPFDPALHEAMAQVPDATVPPNTVVDVFERGYQLRSRLLRPARVVVSRLPDADEKAEAGEDEQES